MTTNRIIRGLSELNELVTPQLTDDVDRTYVREDMGKTFVITPTTIIRVQTMPSTGVEKGEVIAFVNLASSWKITIKASGGTDIISFQNGNVELMAEVDEPTTAAHWAVISGEGGARPTFLANISGSSQANISGIDKIEFDNATYDNNDNFDPSTLYRFTPTVPGFYQLYTSAIWIGTSLVAADEIQIYLYRNNSSFASQRLHVHDALGSQGVQVTGLGVANGTTDYFEAFVQNAARDTSDLDGDPTLTYFQGHYITRFT